MRLALAILAFCGAAFAHPGVGVVVDSRGNVFYTDLKQVLRIDARGNRSVAVPNVHTHELYVDAADNLYGEHLWYTGPQDGSGKWFHRVWRRAPDGRITDVVPVTEGFRRSLSFVRDRAGAMYAAGEDEGAPRTWVRKIGNDGKSTKLADGFHDVGWMAFGQDGNLYVLDGGTLSRVTLQGAVTRLASGLDESSALALTIGKRHAVMGLAADGEGNVYVANYAGRQLKKVGRDGRITVFARSPLSWAPTGIAIAGDRIYILEYGSGGMRTRVRMVRTRAAVAAG